MQEIDAKPRLGHSLHENFQTACYVGHLNGSWFRLETCQVQSFRNEITFCLDALFLHNFLRFSEKLEKKKKPEASYVSLFIYRIRRSFDRYFPIVPAKRTRWNRIRGVHSFVRKIQRDRTENRHAGKKGDRGSARNRRKKKLQARCGPVSLLESPLRIEAAPKCAIPPWLVVALRCPTKRIPPIWAPHHTGPKSATA